MPLLKIETTVPLEDDRSRALASEAVCAVAETTGKPSSVVMVTVHAGSSMSFGGDTESIALFEVRGIELAPDKTEALTHRFTDFAREHLAVPAERVFVIADDVPRGRWGFDRRVL